MKSILEETFVYGQQGENVYAFLIVHFVSYTGLRIMTWIILLSEKQ